MRTVKEDLRKLVDELPDDVTWDEVQYRLDGRQQIGVGLKDLAAGCVVDEAEADKRLARRLYMEDASVRPSITARQTSGTPR